MGLRLRKQLANWLPLAKLYLLKGRLQLLRDKLKIVYSTFIFLTVILPEMSEARHAAKIILLQGQVEKMSAGAMKALPAKKDDLLVEGTTLSTKDRSFVKLLFTDNTQMNLGPNSSMKIEKYQGNAAGVIQVIDGKIRAKVQKDLVAKDPSEAKDKLLIHTKTAAMGVRGTDFQVTYNRTNQNTSLITFESQVAMVKLEGDQGSSGLSSLTEALASDNAVIVSEGQFSAANPRQESATEPVRISPEQLEALRKNETLAAPAVETGASAPAYRSPIPPGVDSLSFVATASVDSVVAAMASDVGDGRTLVKEANATVAQENARMRPASEAKSGVVEGGYVDLSRGIYIAPDPANGAIFDPVTKLFTPDPSVRVSGSGDLALAQGTSISESGEIIRPAIEGQLGGPRGPEASGRGPASGRPEPQLRENLDDLDEFDEEQDNDDVQQGQTQRADTDVNFIITTQ